MNALAVAQGDSTNYTLSTINLNDAKQTILSSLTTSINSDSSGSGDSIYSTAAFTCRTIPIGTWSNDSHAGNIALITSYLGPVENN